MVEGVSPIGRDEIEASNRRICSVTNVICELQVKDAVRGISSVLNY